MMKKTRLLNWVLAAIVIGFFSYLYYPPRTPFSPLGLLTDKSRLESEPKDYIILGFLPYWNLKKLTPDSLEVVTDLAYFSLGLRADGTLLTHLNRREEEPGFTNYKRLLAQDFCPTLESLPTPCPASHLTFVQEDQDALAALLVDPGARRTAINTIMAIIEESSTSGINIDFEPIGSVTPAQRDGLTAFIRDLQTAIINRQSQVILSISLYPSAASRPRLWDISSLTPYLDYFVVMTYDYTLPGDPKTGPNSPLRGAGSLFEHDILTNLSQFTATVPPAKILLGIPFYGYEWDTSDTAKYTPTTNRGAVASLERIQEMIDAQTLELLWDRNSLTPYAVRRENGEVVSQIYFENENSIRLKLDLVKQAGLGGIAIWALGYEGYNPRLWETIGSLRL